MRCRSLFLTLLALLLPAVSSAQPRGLRPADFYKEGTIEDVALRPQGDLVAFTAMTIVDAQGLTEYEFGGPPWEQRETYRRLSPISYVEHVTIPTLILHSENDYRTPIGDGAQWLMALKKRRVPVEMVRYPRSTHDLSRTGEPWLLVDRLERIRNWFAYWWNQQPAPPSTPPTPAGVAR